MPQLCLLDERAVAHRDEPVGSRRDPRIVGDDHQRLAAPAKPIEQPEHVSSRRAVEIAGGFVGEDDQWFVAERAGDRHPLTLAARECRREMVSSICESDLVEQLLGPAPSRPRRAPGEQRGQLDVLDGGQLLHQVESLEDEADRASAQAGERLAR